MVSSITQDPYSIIISLNLASSVNLNILYWRPPASDRATRRVRDPKCKWENAKPRRTSKKPAPTRLIECRARPGSPQRGQRHTRVPLPAPFRFPDRGSVRWVLGLFSPTRKGYFQYRDLMQVRADVSLADEFSRVAARWR